MRPWIVVEPVTDRFCGICAHYKKDIWRAFQGAAQNDDAFRCEPIHEIGMLTPLRLTLQFVIR